MAVHSDPERAVDEARARFRRTLSTWAMDVMELRRRGLHRPVMRPGLDGPDAATGVARAETARDVAQHEVRS